MKNKRLQKWLMFMLMGLMALPLLGRRSLVQARENASNAEQELNQDEKDVDDKDDKDVHDEDDKDVHENDVDDKEIKAPDVGQKDAPESGQHGN